MDNSQKQTFTPPVDGEVFLKTKSQRWNLIFATLGFSFFCVLSAYKLGHGSIEYGFEKIFLWVLLVLSFIMIPISIILFIKNPRSFIYQDSSALYKSDGEDKTLLVSSTKILIHEKYLEVNGIKFYPTGRFKGYELELGKYMNERAFTTSSVLERMESLA
jgi:hypothetical protein